MKKSLPLLFLLASFAAGAAANPHVNAGVATTINNFNELTYSHVSLLLPSRDEYRPGWLPSSWALSYGRLERDGDTSSLLMAGPLWHFDFLTSACNCFFSAGISLTHLFDPEFYDQKRDRSESFGSHTQFTTRLAFGWYLDRQRQWSMSWNFRHISNGGLSEVNPGADFLGLDLQVSY